MARRPPNGIRKLPSGRWQARITDPLTGEQVSIGTFDTQGEAVAARDGARVDQRNGDWIAPSAGDVTLHDWMRDWIESRQDIADTTRQGHLHALSCLGHLGQMKVGDIESAHVRRWLNELEGKDSTRRQRLVFVATAFNQAVAERIIRHNPCDAVPKPKIQDARDPLFLLPHQVDALIRELREPYDDLVATAVWTGMRWGMLRGLRPQDIQDGRITITEQLTNSGARKPLKGRDSATSRHSVPVVAALAPVLERRIAAADAPWSLLFQSNRGNPVSSTAVRENLAQAVEAAGLPDQLVFHDLRHTCASWLARAGALPHEVARWLGHKDATVTMKTYTHLFPDRLEDLATRLDRFGSGSGLEAV